MLEAIRAWLKAVYWRIAFKPWYILTGRQKSDRQFVKEFFANTEGN